MTEQYDLTKMRKNPHAAIIKEKGYSVTVHYSPEDIANGHFDSKKDIIEALVELMSESDTKRLLEHIRDNYNLPCSADIWDCIT